MKRRRNNKKRKGMGEQEETIVIKVEANREHEVRGYKEIQGGLKGEIKRR